MDQGGRVRGTGRRGRCSGNLRPRPAPPTSRRSRSERSSLQVRLRAPSPVSPAQMIKVRRGRAGAESRGPRYHGRKPWSAITNLFPTVPPSGGPVGVYSGPAGGGCGCGDQNGTTQPSLDYYSSVSRPAATLGLRRCLRVRVQPLPGGLGCSIVFPVREHSTGTGDGEVRGDGAAASSRGMHVSP